MKEFPSILNVKNKENFEKMNYARLLCYFRKAIFEHMIREDENNYFDLSCLCIKNSEILNNMVETVIEELKVLGWKCKLSYGNTGLYIYSTEDPPKNCWDGEF